AFVAPSVLAQTPAPSTPDAAPGRGRGPGRGGIGVPGVSSVPLYEERAKDLMSIPAWEFYDSGCADDLTVNWNREALQKVRLESRVMVDVSTIDTSSTLFGKAMPHPIMLAPTASH